jgi:thiol-disulfide isomerase/thioredoxin
LWVATGLMNDRADVWLRVERKELLSHGYGFQGGPTIPARSFFGDHQAIDEGDLFVATRSTAEAAEEALAMLKLRETLGKKPAPAIIASKWFHAAEPVTIESLRGKVVLLDFWGTWCGPCVKKLPAVEAIHKKYAERGLVVIGVHSEQGADSVGEFLEKEPLSFPIAVDTGKTAKSYGVNSWPTYFLIDKSGKSKWGFSANLPSEAQIEELLR